MNARRDVCRVMVVDQIPHEHQAIVGTTRKSPPSARTPFNAIDGRRMSLQLDNRLPRLSHVQDANDIRVLCKSRKKMRVVRRG